MSIQLNELLQIICEELYNDMPIKMNHHKAHSTFRKTLKDNNATYQSTATVETVAENGQTLAFYIARENMPSVLQAALDLKSNVQHRDIHGRTLLHGACECRSIMMMSDGDPAHTADLLMKYIDVNTPDNQGHTPLFEVGFMVRENTHDFADPSQAQQLSQFVEHLIARGADIHHRNNKGHTFAHKTSRLPKHLRAVFEPYIAEIERKTLSDAVNAGPPKAKRNARKI